MRSPTSVCPVSHDAHRKRVLSQRAHGEYSDRWYDLDGAGEKSHGDDKKKSGPTYRILTEEEARVLFDETARRLLGISGEEFVRRYDAGYYDDKPDLHEEVIELHLMLPFSCRVTVP